MNNINNNYLNPESITWLKMLDQLQEENITMKKRFSENIKSGKDDVYLKKLESIHNNLLNKDTMLSLLRHEIIDLNEMMSKESKKNNPGNKNLDTRQNKLREDMNRLEKEFGRLKEDFINHAKQGEKP